MFSGVCSIASNAQEVLWLSPDIHLEPISGPSLLTPHDVALDTQQGDVGSANLGPLSDESDVTAFGLVPNGDRLFSFDITTDLPGSLLTRPGDIIRYDGTAYSIEFSALAAELPPGTRADAVSLSSGGLLLSFDTSILLPGGIVAADEDLVEWNGSVLSLVLHGTAVGMDSAWEVDAAQDLGGGHYLVSFDTSGVLGRVYFDDEDAREFDGTGWSLRFPTISLGANWSPADLDAVFVPEPSGWAGLLAALGLLYIFVWRRTLAASRPTGLALLAIVSLAPPATAADGAFEINQACADGPGCFVGDTAGFPVTIASPGAYQLTGNLTVPDENTTAISITTSTVDINLGGFLIEGPHLPGSGDGINQIAFLRRATVRNGAIAGMGRDGVALGDEARVHELTLVENGRDGIVVRSGGIVRDNIVYDSGDDGIVASAACLIVDNTINAVDDNGPCRDRPQPLRLWTALSRNTDPVEVLSMTARHPLNRKHLPGLSLRSFSGSSSRRVSRTPMRAYSRLISSVRRSRVVSRGILPGFRSRSPGPANTA